MVDPRLTPATQEQNSTPKESLEKSSGAGSGVIPELIAHPSLGEGERMLRGISNCFIVLGNDRPAGLTSGYGGSGTPGSACIDLFVGPQGDQVVDTVLGKKVPLPKSFKKDAARIYISQLTDLDKNFEIPEIRTLVKGTPFSDEVSAGLSGIGIKADNVRLIARQNIKLVTVDGELVTNPNVNKIKGGISLIAGYDNFTANNNDFVKKNPLEPMVRGNKLIEFLEKLIELIDKLDSKTNNFIKSQNKFNIELEKHTHQIAATAENSGEMVAKANRILLTYHTETVPQIVLTEKEKELIKQYFNFDSPGYINSRFHRLN